METRYLNYLHTVAPDLHHVATQIGTAVRINGFGEDFHEQRILSNKQMVNQVLVMVHG